MKYTHPFDRNARYMLPAKGEEYPCESDISLILTKLGDKFNSKLYELKSEEKEMLNINKIISANCKDIHAILLNPPWNLNKKVNNPFRF